MKAFMGVIAAWVLVQSGLAVAGDATPLVMRDEAQAIRQSLSNGWSAETAANVRADDALKNYRKAALYGSSEGYYRAARLSLSARSADRRASGVCLLQVASQLGHAQAGEMVATLARQQPQAMRRCNDTALRQALSI